MSYFANIQTPSEFPFTIKMKNRRNVVMERAPVDILPDLFEFYNKFAFTTNGIGTDDYSDLDDFVSKAANRYTFYMRESKTDRIILFLQIFPTTLCRSLKPVYNAAYTVRDTAYKGVAEPAIAAGLAEAQRQGYIGFLGRVATINHPTYQGSYRNGSSLVGCLPMNVDVARNGWTDDLILMQPYSNWKSPPEPSNLSLPTPNKHPEEDTLNSTFGDCIQGMTCLMQSGMTAMAQVASKDQMLKVEAIIYESTLAGRSFGLDEFNIDGRYARKMLRKSITIIVTNDNGHCLCGILCGPPLICRSKTAPNLWFYIIKNRSPSSQEPYSGLEGKYIDAFAYKLIRTVAKNHGCAGIMTDNLLTDMQAIRNAQKAGLMIVGSVPSSTYVKGQGYTDTVLMHQKLSPLEKSSL